MKTFFEDIKAFLSKRPGIIEALIHSTWDDWRETFYWFGFNVLGGLMPIWATPFLLRIHKQRIAYAELVSHGEFALYSAAFLAPVLLVIFRIRRRDRYILGPGIGLLALAALLFCAFIYSTAASTAGTPSQQSLDVDFVVQSSSVIFAVTIVLALLVAFVENRATNLNLREMETRERETLRTKFDDKMGEENGGQR